MIPNKDQIELDKDKLSDTLALDGHFAPDFNEELLAHSVIENDQDAIDEGKLISEALNQGFSGFNPDLMFDKMVSSYSMAENIYGEKLLQLVSGYDSSYLKKNIKIPEFAREVKKKIKDKFKEMCSKGLIDKEGIVSDKGVSLASLILYTEELDHLIPKGFYGERVHKKNFIYGDKEDERRYKKGDRYRDIALKSSIKLAVRRLHNNIETEDLMVYEHKSRGSLSLIYGIDSSGSMRGQKIETAKKAGIALAFKAIESRDKVGLIIFGEEIKDMIPPGNNFIGLLHAMTKIKASNETNLTETIKESVLLFPKDDSTKHLILLTDAVPTVGKVPEKEVLEAVSIARASGITISLVGIGLDHRGKQLAENICRIGEGRLYVVRSLADVDKVVLEDYYAVSSA